MIEENENLNIKSIVGAISIFLLSILLSGIILNADAIIGIQVLAIQKKLVQFFLVLSALVVVFIRRSSEYWIVFFGVFVYVAFNLLGELNGSRMLAAQGYIALYIVILLYVLLVFSNGPHVKTVMLGMIAGYLLIVIPYIIEAFEFGANILLARYDRRFFTGEELININSISLTAVMFYGVALNYAKIRRGRVFTNIITWIVFGASLIVITLHVSVMAFLILLVFLFTSQNYSMCFLIILSSVSFLAVNPIYWSAISMRMLGDGSSSGERSWLMMRSLDQFSDSIFFGVGHTYATILKDHNTFTNMLANSGLFGFLLILLLYFNPAFFMNAKNYTINIKYTAVMTMVLVVSPPSLMISIVLWLWIMETHVSYKKIVWY